MFAFWWAGAHPTKDNLLFGVGIRSLSMTNVGAELVDFRECNYPCKHPRAPSTLAVDTKLILHGKPKLTRVFFTVYKERQIFRAHDHFKTVCGRRALQALPVGDFAK
jgi:hypothetical protein